jgi:hypothetical protein
MNYRRNGCEILPFLYPYSGPHVRHTLDRKIAFFFSVNLGSPVYSIKVFSYSLFFFRNGVFPASASIDAHSRFIKDVQRLYK